MYMFYIIFKHVHTDANECLEENGGCEQICTNVLGSYFCSCEPEFRLNVDKHQCDGTLEQ